MLEYLVSVVKEITSYSTRQLLLTTESGKRLALTGSYYSSYHSYLGGITIYLRGCTPLQVEINDDGPSILSTSGVVVDSKELQEQLVVKIAGSKNLIYAMTGDGKLYFKGANGVFAHTPFDAPITNVVVTENTTFVVTANDEVYYRLLYSNDYLPLQCSMSSILHNHEIVYIKDKVGKWFRWCNSYPDNKNILLPLPSNIENVKFAPTGVCVVVDGVSYRY